MDDGFQAASHSSRRERSRSPHVAQVVEHDLARFDSDDEPLTRLTRIDSTPSHVVQDSLPSWQDYDGVDDERLREGHCRNVWARVGVSDFVEQHASSALDGRVPSTVPALSLPTWVDRERDESSSVHSESCWGEMEDRIDDEAVEWGLMPDPVICPVQIPRCHTASQRLPSRRLVLVGGGGSQNCLSPQAEEEQIGSLASPNHSQEGRAQAARAPLDADHQGRVVVVVREEDASHGRNPRPEADVA